MPCQAMVLLLSWEEIGKAEERIGLDFDFHSGDQNLHFVQESSTPSS